MLVESKVEDTRSSKEEDSTDNTVARHDKAAPGFRHEQRPASTIDNQLIAFSGSLEYKYLILPLDTIQSNIPSIDSFNTTYSSMRESNSSE